MAAEGPMAERPLPSADDGIEVRGRTWLYVLAVIRAAPPEARVRELIWQRGISPVFPFTPSSSPALGEGEPIQTPLT